MQTPRNPRTHVSLVFGALSALVLTACSLRPAHAQSRSPLTLEVLNATVTQGGSGSFDVDLFNSNTTGSFDVSGFSFELNVDSGSGITFTSVDTNTTSASYLFGTYQSGPAPFSFTAFPNTDFIASDDSFTAPFFTTIAAGQTYGLGHVTFSAASNATLGATPVTIVSNGTSLSDINANTIAYTPQNGAITVTAAATTAPEPGSLAMLACGGLSALTLAARRRRKG